MNNFDFNALKFGNEEHDAFIKRNKPENKFSGEQWGKRKMNRIWKLCKQKENSYGSDVNQAFNNYARIVIRYLEVKQKSDEQQKEYHDDLIEEQFPDSIEDEDKFNDYILHPKKGTMDMFVKKK